MIDEKTFSASHLEREKEVTDNIDLREVMDELVYSWKWFVLSLIISFLLAFLYLKNTQQQFKVTSTIFIDDKDGGGVISELSALEDLGLFAGGTKKNVINEIGVLKSRTLMENVIKNLKLNISYYYKEKFIDHELYNGNIPFEVNFYDKKKSQYELDTTFLIFPTSKTHFLLKDVDDNLINEGTFGKMLETELGEIIISKNENLNIESNKEVIVKITPLINVVNHYRTGLNIELESSKSSLLILSLKDNIKERGVNILDDLVFQYNNDAIEYKSLITANTDKFINERIIDISIDLESVDRGIEVFKTQNELTNIEYESGLILESDSNIEKLIVDINSQIKLIDYVKDYMENNKIDLIPANLGIKDGTTSQNTLEYNQLLLERNRIIKNSSELNPTVINLDNQIQSLRQSIEQSLDNLRSSLTIQLNEANIQSYQLDTKIKNAPKQEREFQDIKRKQLIIESLYLYLLQKREENAISLGIPVPNAKVIDKSNGSNYPVSPNPKLIFLIGGALGLFLPIFVISVRSLWNNKIQTYGDVEKIIKAPILGDIPKVKLKENFIIKENNKSSIAEAFRMLRTKLNYMFPGSKTGSKTIFITSTIGNEGKTFIAINLGSVLASINKKVLLIGADLRKPKIKKYYNFSSDLGLTHFLVDHNISISDIIVSTDHNNYDIILAGEIPPNPSNLLMNDRFDEMLTYARQHYDYIIVDTPPVSLVTDTLLMAPHADLFLYIIRANYLDKRLLVSANELYEKKLLNNMALIINEINIEKKGYGYGYGE